MALISEAVDDGDAGFDEDDGVKFCVKADVADDDDDGAGSGSGSCGAGPSSSSDSLHVTSPKRAKAEERRRIVKEEMDRQKSLRET